MSESQEQPSCKCALCGNEYECGAGIYPIRRVKGWGGVMLCTKCRESNYDGIVPTPSYTGSLLAELKRLGIAPAYNESGFIIIPD